MPRLETGSEEEEELVADGCGQRVSERGRGREIGQRLVAGPDALSRAEEDWAARAKKKEEPRRLAI